MQYIGCLTYNLHMTINVNKQHKNSLSFSERIANWITNKVGTMVCAGLFALLAFISLPSVLSSHNTIIIISWVTQAFLQLVLLPVIIVGQNIQNKHSELRADATYELAKKIDDLLERTGK